MRKKQREIINGLNVQPTIDPHEEIADRTLFLANYLGTQGLNGFVLGISGGQDSLLAGLLAKRAVELRRNDGFKAEFHAMLQPYGQQADRADAELAIKTIGPDFVHDLNIAASVDAHVTSYNDAEDQPMSDYDKGNIKARARMTDQYAVARPHNLAVIGTDHAAEAVHGFFTKFGDGAADILPLSGLTKRQGKTMLRALGAPAVFITKTPTADLLDNNQGQADEYEMGVSYDDTDDYLEGKVVSDEAAKIIEAHYDATHHKRQLPKAYIGGNLE